jgi:RTX calcium-binding nonapeptide repeat (4 copies)
VLDRLAPVASFASFLYPQRDEVGAGMFSRGPRYALVVGVMLAFGVFAPNAVAGSISYDGEAIVFEAVDNLNHEVAFRYDQATNRDHILDDHVISPAPGDCQYEDFDNEWVSCPGHNDVRVELGAGNDAVFFHTTTNFAGDCFESYVINLGEGSNENTFDNCVPAAVAVVTSGSGDDQLRGAAASTSTAIFAGGGNDSVNDGEGDDIIHGGDGADGVFGFLGNDQVYGEGGNDRLRGGEGNDLEDGGAGDDDIGFRDVNTVGDPDPGADTLLGGDGIDLLRLDGHAGAMAISLDGQPNDGMPGEGDNVGSDIENILGTSGNDSFNGSPGPDGFDGAGGSDDIHGAGGNDNLTGNGGDDSVFGDAGNDQVEGSYGTDSVTGGAGTDKIYGDTASCSVFCEPDVDQLFARDGERDVVNCGGPGVAQIDQLDIAGNCGSFDKATIAAGACAKAKSRLAKAKKKLRKLKARGAGRKAVAKQKKKIKKAKKAKKRACR